MEPIIKVEKLWFAYEEKKWVLREIDMDVQKGEIVSLIGPNGSGKTTLVKHFNGLLKPIRGKVIVNGKDTKKCSIAELSRIVGYVFQNPNHQIFSNTVFDEIAFGPRNLGFKEVNNIVERVLSLLNLKEKKDTLPFLLSMGEKERVAIASLLSMKPKILILDEPTTAQDIYTYSRIVEILRKLKKVGKTVVIISHDMEFVAEVSDRIFVMSRGKVVREGKPKEIFSDFELLENLGLSPPPITRVGKLLNSSFTPLTIKEFMSWLNETGKLY